MSYDPFTEQTTAAALLRIADALEAQTTALEAIASRLNSWDSGGGINLVPGRTMTELLEGITEARDDS